MENKDNIVWFFAGGNFANGRINAFTGNFTRLMAKILGDQFRVVSKVYHPWSFFNVVWALTYAQKPFKRPESKRYMRETMKEMTNDEGRMTNDEGQMTNEDGRMTKGVVIVGSSYGTVVAAQFACYLASSLTGDHSSQITDHRPLVTFSVALGTSMISKQSKLFKTLEEYRDQGIIKHLIYDELQDEGDNAIGVGGTTRFGAYLSALGIVFPYFTRRYKRPSFLNQNLETGHVHQRRAQSKQKAIDFIRVMLIEKELCGHDMSFIAQQECGIKQ